MKLIGYILIFIPFLFTLVSCDGDRFYEYNYPIVDETWHAEEKLSFEFDVEDTVAAYNIYINLRNAKEYEFSNFFLFMYTKKPDLSINKDTIECPISAPDGKWYGNTAGNMVDNRIWIKTNQRFSKPGKYAILLEHAMRTESVKHIADVGIRIEKM